MAGLTDLDEVLRRYLYRCTRTESGCLVYPGANPRNYVNVWVDGRVWLGHRLVWIMAHGPLPDEPFTAESVTVDHRCGVRRCLEVDHLRLLPMSVNAGLHHAR